MLQPLADAYGLLMHRNGQWEWTLAPGVSPSSRYQHAAVSVDGTFSLVYLASFLLPPRLCSSSFISGKKISAEAR